MGCFMQITSQDLPLLVWDPFLGWESSQDLFAMDLNEPGIFEPVESALPCAVETADVEDAVMAPEGFTHWF